jgi:hypothetical protein
MVKTKSMRKGPRPAPDTYLRSGWRALCHRLHGLPCWRLHSAAALLDSKLCTADQLGPWPKITGLW